jgi:predicted transcriptional regulator
VYDIIADILNLCKKPMKKTPLRNKVSASEKLLNYCLNEAGLLETVLAEDSTILYHTTPRGIEYLNVYNSLRQIMRSRIPVETVSEKNNEYAW